MEDKPSSDDIKKDLKRSMKKTPEKVYPARMKRVGFFDRPEEFKDEESAAKSCAYATLQVWKTFTNHMKDLNPHVKFENFSESGISKWVIFLRNQDLEEKNVQKHFNNLRWFCTGLCVRGTLRRTPSSATGPSSRCWKSPLSS